MSRYLTRRQAAVQPDLQVPPRRKKVTSVVKSVGSKAAKIKNDTLNLDKTKKNDTTKAKPDNGKKKLQVQRKNFVPSRDSIKDTRASGLRQMSLTESFMNQSTRRLRTRKTQKNYKDDSSLIQKYIPAEKRNSIVQAKRLDSGKARVPVYKTVVPDDSVKNETEIYDFRFDLNDSNERVKKKKKRPTRKAVVNKKKKTISKKPIVKEKVIDHKEPPVKVSPNENNVAETATQPTAEPIVEKEISMVLPPEDAPINDQPSFSVEQADTKPENLPSQLSKTAHIESTPLQPSIAKPTIRLIEELRNTKVSVLKDSQKANTVQAAQFTSTPVNKLPAKVNAVGNYSFFEKHLSPITKSISTFDPSSPWRGPPIRTFSQAKSFYQSTPENKYPVAARRFVGKTESKNQENAVKEIIQRKNENLSPEKIVNLSNPKKNTSTTGRKFGTEITNIDHSIQSNNTIPEPNETERIVIEAEDPITDVQSSDKNNSNANVSMLDQEDKENAALNFQTPKKSTKKRLKRLKSPRTSPLKDPSRQQQAIQKENLDPQPGPSGLQNSSSVLNEDRVLRQSNLNNFLNITEVPQTTLITTPHGIFDDINSSSVPGKSVKKTVDKCDSDINNAFGFNDDDSNQEVPSIEVKKNRVNAVRADKPRGTLLKVQRPAPVRLPKPPVIKKLITAKTEATEKKKENTNLEPTMPIADKKLKAVIDVQNFSDTFDIFSETGEFPAVEAPTVPLFVDYEPSHFTQPPRHSYKRNRASRNDDRSDDSMDEEETIHKKNVKRKKGGKLKKEDEKRIKEWVKNINQTFEEIDQYDLVVE